MVSRGVLAGAVAVGICCQIIYVPAVAIGNGIVAGVCMFFCYRYVQGRLEVSWGLLDTTGILSSSLFPSITGTILSCILLSSYHYQGLNP